jgi:gliding motility-associated-like protein
MINFVSIATYFMLIRLKVVGLKMWSKSVLVLVVSFCIICFDFINAQPICLGIDKVVCPGQGVTINDCGSIGGGGGSAPYTVATIPYAPDPFNVGTTVTMTDDAISNVINIGFNFCFFGTTYTQFYIGSNGWIGFSAEPSGQVWTTFTSASIPSTNSNVPKNCIMGPWQDWHPGAGTTGPYIRYQTLGTAPNRRLVVSWNNCPMFSCTSNFGTFQIVIFETSNVIETRIQNKPACITWAQGTAVQGIHNLAGTAAITVTGRNSTQWIANDEAHRFTPGSFGVNWGNTLGQTFPYNNGSLTISNVPNGTTGYFLKSGCGGGSGVAISDTTWLTKANPTVTLVAQNDVCSQGIGSVTATPGSGSPSPINYTWNPAGPNSNTINGAAPGTYTVTITDGNNCNASASATVGDTPAAFSVSATPVSCPGGTDGTATAVVTPSSGIETYEWNNGQTTQTATGLTAGNYWCFVQSNTGCSDTVNVQVTEIPGIQLTITNLQDANCYSIANGQATISVIQGTGPYSYDWSLSSSNTNSASDLAAGQHTLIVTDLNGCVDSISMTIGQPNPVVITSITPDTQICSEDNITLSVTANGGSSPYIYSWVADGNVEGTTSSITVQPSNAITVYCVTVSEVCGSPSVQECVTITNPTPIEPNVTPDEIIKCAPGNFQFSNTSTNSLEIATTTYSFSNGQSFTISGNQGFSNVFPLPGNYNVSISTTSIYGCLYDTVLTDLILVVASPFADFTIAKNPVTWFETTVQTSDISIGAITDWNWISPDAISIANGTPTGILQYPEGVTGIYPITLVVTSQLGCSDSITLNIEIVPDVLMYVPNSFTPDDDEHNQQWLYYIEGVDFENFQVEIFNRWGEVIWVSQDAKEPWSGNYNGTRVQPGTYIWRISYKEKDSDGRKYHTGYINVLR